mmetsp:Transcript_13628/g.17954  ORF Transcript_13628/g.17954 Transcript_13628/m.17954 type:complete len:252 (-) Transcript_13628:132-887(-)
MALRSFGKQTLNDNWYEDRASKLDGGGVLANDGTKNFLSTSRSAHMHPEKNFVNRGKSRAENQRKLVLQKGALATTMVQPHNTVQSTKQRPITGPDAGCWAVVPKSLDSDHDRHLRTTQQDGYGSSGRFTATAQRKMRDPSAPFAGSAKADRLDRGLQATGAIGEVFQKKGEPQYDTASQRAWLSYNDPLIKYKNEGIPEAKMPLGASLQIGEREYNYDTTKYFSKGRNMTLEKDLTASTLRPGKNIYMDA